MRVNIIYIILLFFVTKIVVAATSDPFVDLNSVTKITKSGDVLTFFTPNGTKSVQLTTNEWSYSLSPSVTFPGVDPNPYRPNRAIDIKVPVWYPSSTYVTVISVDDLKDPEWMLVSLSGESAVYSEHDLINLKTGQVFSIPYERIHDFSVVGNIVWLGGQLGLTKLDLTSQVRTRVNTLPIFKDIVSYIDMKRELYYLTHNYGFFSVDKETNEIRPVIEINSYLEQGYKFVAVKEINGKFWLMASKIGNTGYITGHILLLHYDPVTGSVEEINTNIRYAKELMLYGENSIIGYGSKTEYYEGGESNAYGGIFRYNYKSKSLRVLSKQPAVVLQLNPPKAMGVWFTDGPTIIDYYESPDIETSFSLIKSEYLTDEQEDYISTDIRTGKKVTYISNPSRLKMLRNMYNMDRKSAIKKNIDVYEKVFGKLKIKLKTIEYQIGKIQMQQYDPNSSTPPAQRY